MKFSLANGKCWEIFIGCLVARVKANKGSARYSVPTIQHLIMHFNEWEYDEKRCAIWCHILSNLYFEKLASYSGQKLCIIFMYDFVNYMIANTKFIMLNLMRKILQITLKIGTTFYRL